MHLCLHTHTSCAILPAPPAEPKLTEIAGPAPQLLSASRRVWATLKKKKLEKLLVCLGKGEKLQGLALVDPL